MSSHQFEHLFTPLEVGPVRLRNRIFLTPHATMFTSDECDTHKQEDSLYPAFKALVEEVYRVGDANVGGARLGNAMYDAQRIGRLI